MTGVQTCALPISSLRELQELDFAIQEAVLFLDTHPRSEVALSYYRYVTGLRRKAAEEYNRVCGPLTSRDSRGRRWDWVNSPWPWEREG